MSRGRLANILGLATVVVIMIVIGVRHAERTGNLEDAASMATVLGRAGAPTTSRDDLARTIQRMEDRLKRHRGNRAATLLLSDALMRQARVVGQPALVHRAVFVLEPLVQSEPGDYALRRVLATAYAAAHRFGDALREAEWCREQRPDDPWNFGVIGDAQLELGEYDSAFATIQKMVDIKPSAAAYSRVSYALELQGKLEPAIQAMQLAVDAAPPRDPESIAWFHAHLADLLMQVGRVPEARLEYAWAERAFPRHPLVRTGVARLKESEGDDQGALAMYRDVFEETGMPEIAVAMGEILQRQSRYDDAERLYSLAQERWRRGGSSEQDHLARFLADHDRNVDEAVQLAERRIAVSSDIGSFDTLAWACFKAGRLEEAGRAATRALRTGTRNASILYHAAAIHAALGDRAGATRLLNLIPGGFRGSIRLTSAIEKLRAKVHGAGQLRVHDVLVITRPEGPGPDQRPRRDERE